MIVKTLIIVLMLPLKNYLHQSKVIIDKDNNTIVHEDYLHDLMSNSFTSKFIYINEYELKPYFLYILFQVQVKTLMKDSVI